MLQLWVVGNKFCIYKSFKFVLFNESFPNPAKFQIRPNFGQGRICKKGRISAGAGAELRYSPREILWIFHTPVLTRLCYCTVVCWQPKSMKKLAKTWTTTSTLMNVTSTMTTLMRFTNLLRMIQQDTIMHNISYKLTSRQPAAYGQIRKFMKKKLIVVQEL